MVGNTTGQLSPRKESPRFVGAGLFGPSTNSSIFKIHQIFNISYFPQFNLSFQKKKKLFPKIAKNRPKIYKKKLPNSGQ